MPAGSIIDMFVDTEKGAMAFSINDVFKGTAAQQDFLRSGTMLISVQMLYKNDSVMLIQP